MSEGFYSSDEERARALRYSRTRQWLALADMLLGLLAMLVALMSGLSAGLRDRVDRVVPRRFAGIMPFAASGIALSSLLSLPMSFYEGYIVEHRYGLSNQTFRAWIVDWMKGLGVGVALGAPLLQGAHWVMRRYPRHWWAVLSGLVVPFSVLLANLGPVLLMPLFNKFEPLKDRDLEKRIRDLAADQGVTVSSVMQMDMSKQTKKANAFFTGVGNTKRIVLGDTMLNEFTPDEVEVVLAHELGHQVHRDLWKLISFQVPLTLGTFYAMHCLAPPAIRRFGQRWGLDTGAGVLDPAALPLLGLVGSAVGLALGPAVNAVVRRWIEHPADTYALELTGKTGPFIGAMEKLGRMSLSDPNPPRIIKWLFHDHPTLQERIDYAKSFAAGREGA
ncbi:MAG TPA: M48 family metallopeptidase [Chloroflexota bacterium]|nr:M48 family metallopeptidase [Chloroflexota bacterium]